LLLDVLASPGLNILMTREANAESNGPGLTGIDVWQHSDNNWWCAWEPERHRTAASQTLYGTFFNNDRRPYQPDVDLGLAVAGASAKLGPLLRSSWLWNNQDAAEQLSLSQIVSAPKLLSTRAIDWTEHPGWFGRRSGRDTALALAVRTTRYGCQRQGGHGAYSKAAFQLLHSRFPDSPAAKSTRYWFDCSHFYYGCGIRREEDEDEQGTP
jgi:hypothetical protein